MGSAPSRDPLNIRFACRIPSPAPPGVLHGFVFAIQSYFPPLTIGRWSSPQRQWKSVPLSPTWPHLGPFQEMMAAAEGARS